MYLIVQIEKKLGNNLLKADFETDSHTLAVLGESGAGKSLLLKCIAGIEKPDKGKIILDNQILFDSQKRINLRPQKRQIGYLFQNYALFPNMTVYKNISSTAKNKNDVMLYIKRFGLLGKENSYPAMLSGGEQQRTALARLLASNPKVLLFDEPFSALDSNRKSELERIIIDLLEEKKCPSILVTHDRNEAYRIAEKIAVMNQGNLSAPIAKHAFFENPSTVTAAQLSGCKNITHLKWIDDKTAFATDWGIKITPDFSKDFNSPQPHTQKAEFAAFRAHYFFAAEKPEESNVFTCNIKHVIEDTFSYIIYFEQENGYSTAKTLCWEMDKELWKKIKADLPDKKLYAKIDTAKLMLLES